jgi:hypothetical protein
MSDINNREELDGAWADVLKQARAFEAKYAGGHKALSEFVFSGKSGESVPIGEDWADLSAHCRRINVECARIFGNLNNELHQLSGNGLSDPKAPPRIPKKTPIKVYADDKIILRDSDHHYGEGFLEKLRARIEKLID